MSFDPDKYTGGFDPDAYVAEPRKYSAPMSALHGAAQGVTMGFGDEMEAGWKSLFDKKRSYKQIRDELRADNSAAEQQNPKSYIAGNVAGSILPAAGAAAATGGTSLTAALSRIAPSLAAGQGAVQGAGYSNADSAAGLARDTGVGAGVGLAGYGVGQAAGAAGRAFSGLFRKLGVRAEATAAQKAAEEIADKIASAKGQLGGEVQKGSRYVENLTRLEQAMTPAQQAELSAQRASGAVPGLEQRVAQSTLDALPQQAATIGAKDAELAALKQGASGALASRKADLLKPQFGKDALSFAKSYAEPVIAMYAADKAGEALGLDPRARAALDASAGVVFGRTRAGKALMTRLSRPGNAAALARTGESAGGLGAQLLKLLARGSAPVVTQELIGGTP